MAIQDYYRELTFQRNDYTGNGTGGQIDNWVDVTGDFEGLINQASSKEILAAQQRQEEIDSKLFTDIDILPVYNVDGERIPYRVIDSIEDNKVYRIVSAPKNTVDRQHHWKWLLRRVDSDG